MPHTFHYGAPLNGADPTVWRYMSLPKFILVVLGRQLHLSRLDKFDDGLEGRFTSPAHSIVTASQSALREAARQSFRLRAGLGGETLELSDSVLDVLMKGTSADELEGRYRRATVACSWFVGVAENERMWRDFAPEGVAIRSRLSLVARSITDNRMVMSSDVFYAAWDDDNQQIARVAGVVSTKRRSDFEHESEVRLLYVKDEELEEQPPEGLDFEVDPVILIDRVITAPGMDNLFLKSVSTILRAGGIERPAVRSEIDQG